jgi:hypothetical protein
LDIYDRDAGLPMTERIRDTEKKKRFETFFSKQEVETAPITSTYLTYRIRKKSFDRNITIMLQNNYMIIICINDNNSAINNNYRPLQDFKFFFEIPMGKRKDFFEIYRLLGHVSSKRLASPFIKIIKKRSPSKSLLFQLYEVFGFIEDSPY